MDARKRMNNLVKQTHTLFAFAFMLNLVLLLGLCLDAATFSINLSGDGISSFFLVHIIFCLLNSLSAFLGALVISRKVRHILEIQLALATSSLIFYFIALPNIIDLYFGRSPAFGFILYLILVPVFFIWNDKFKARYNRIIKMSFEETN